MKHPFRRKNLSPRLFPYYLVAAVVFALAKPTPIGFALGGALVGLGMALRVWGAGHLVKNDRLTDQEFLTLKQHPTIGADIVENLKFLKEAAQLVRYHHEQPDGRGYPEGLEGDDIPLGARIILVVDAFDAMTSDRPYRKGLELEKVVEQFERHSGKQFDDRVVRIVLRLIQDDRFPFIIESDPTTAIYESLRERL